VERGERTAIAVADDGELQGVRHALRGLGHAFAEWKRTGPEPDADNPTQLLITTVSRALAANYHRRRGSGRGGPVWIAIATRESLSRRNALVASGFDYLVRWPLHPGALHMLLGSALFRGSEQRQVSRLAVGHPVRIRVGRSSRAAALVDISPRGARVFTAQEIAAGQKLGLELPGELMGGAPLSLGATAVRVRQAAAERGQGAEFAIGIRFAPLEPEQKTRLAGLLRRISVEPATWSEATPASKSAAPKNAPPRARRGRYTGEVMAYSSAGGAGRLISGRNLSVGGMCADPHPALAVGQTVELALEIGDGSPIQVRAEVVREARDSGVGLRFCGLGAPDQQRLSALVDSLPSIEALAPGARPAPLVAQLLGRLRRPRR
jgi:hypothetical protein